MEPSGKIFDHQKKIITHKKVLIFWWKFKDVVARRLGRNQSAETSLPSSRLLCRSKRQITPDNRKRQDLESLGPDKGSPSLYKVLQRAARKSALGTRWKKIRAPDRSQQMSDSDSRRVKRKDSDWHERSNHGNQVFQVKNWVFNLGKITTVNFHRKG